MPPGIFVVLSNINLLRIDKQCSICYDKDRKEMNAMNTIWEQWDEQKNKPVEAYIELNNLYLRVERGEVALTRAIENELWQLSRKAYRRGDPMLEWWDSEFEKLPGWEG